MALEVTVNTIVVAMDAEPEVVREVAEREGWKLLLGPHEWGIPDPLDALSVGDAIEWYCQTVPERIARFGRDLALDGGHWPPFPVTEPCDGGTWHRGIIERAERMPDGSPVFNIEGCWFCLREPEFAIPVPGAVSAA